MFCLTLTVLSTAYTFTYLYIEVHIGTYRNKNQSCFAEFEFLKHLKL